MKTRIFVKIGLTLLIIALFSTLYSCGMLFADGDEGGNVPETVYDPMPDQGNENETAYTVTTTCLTDDFGLAGSYTMLNAKAYNVGDKVELSATVNDGYNFEGWYITSSPYADGTCLSTDLTYSYTMQNKSVTIVPVYSVYTLTTSSATNLSGAAGTFTRMNNQKVSEGKTVELTATVNDGYNFEGWYINEICVSRSLSYTYTMEKANVVIEAQYSFFELSTVGYAMDEEGNAEAGFHAGTYTQHSQTKVAAGETVTLTATVNEGYNFVGWYVDGVCVGTEREYTFTMEKSNVTVEAIYVYYLLKSSATYEWDSLWDRFIEFDNPSLYISPVYAEEKVSVGKTITLTATEIEGYTFIDWRTAEATMCQDMTYTFDMPAENFYVYAYYQEN